jgi:tRNA 2-selenouridine synthase
MKYPALLNFMHVLSELDTYDTIIDARSESEYALDHIPGAINCPVLDDEQRILVGTTYKQVNAFEAKKIGAPLVAKNIAHYIETLWADKPRDWKPLVYCWRGGNRSGSMAHIMAKVGWPVVQLDGGYKAYRAHISSALGSPPGLEFHVICGTTGSGKSRLLETMERVGAQVLDLEQLAAHRGSVLGNLPSQPQPSQKMFETRIWD